MSSASSSSSCGGGSLFATKPSGFAVHAARSKFHLCKPRLTKGSAGARVGEGSGGGGGARFIRLRLRLPRAPSIFSRQMVACTRLRTPSRGSHGRHGDVDAEGAGPVDKGGRGLGTETERGGRQRLKYDTANRRFYLWRQQDMRCDERREKHGCALLV